MKKKLYVYIPFLVVALFMSMSLSCGDAGTGKKTEVTSDSLMSEDRDSLFASSANFSDTVTIKYAKGLKVDYVADGIVVVTISNPDASSRHSAASARLALVSKGADVTAVPQGCSTVHVPVRGVICMTALQLSNFAAIGCEEYIVGMTSLRHIFNPKVKRQMEDGTTVKIGKEGAFDVETVIAAHPDFIFVSESKRGGFEQLKDCGIPLIPHHGYKETDPLGQAEWLKLVGLLVGEERRANAVFADIENKYNTLKAEVAEKITSRPTVVSGRQVRDGWYVMGGKSYLARIFDDAGADYFMKDDAGTGGSTLDFESVYAKAMRAQFWQIDGSFEGDYTYGTLLAEDMRYGDLRAFKEKNVIFCNFSQVPYRELSPVEPHFLLADFVKVFHPEILPDYEPKYYKRIKE